MDIQSHDKNHPSLIQIMTTEHYNLQAGRSLTLSDANGRAGFFLGTVSSTLIALAFVGNTTHVGSQLGTAFFVFALVLFPTLFFLGLFTFDSVLQSAIEETICVRGISRIRHLYVELAPQMQAYFILPTHDNAAGIFRRAGWWQSFLTLAGIIAVITAFLQGSFSVCSSLNSLPSRSCSASSLAVACFS